MAETQTVTTIKKTENADDALRFFANLPGSQGFYAKVYRVVGSGPPEFLVQLDDPEAIDDEEVYCLNLARERRWGRTAFAIIVFKHGEKGIKARTQIAVDPGEPAGGQGTTLGDALGVVRQVADVVGERHGGASSPDAIVKGTVDALKAGAELARAHAPAAGAESATTKLLGEVLAKMLTPAPAVDPLAGLTKTIELLDKMGLLRKGEDEAAGGAADPVSQLEQLGKVLDVVERLGGRSAGEPKSTLVQIFETIAPQIPVVVDRLTTTVNKGLDFARWRLEAQLGAARSGAAAAAATPPALPEPMRQFMAELARAIKANDHAFFAPLAVTIASQLEGGFAFVDGIRRGAIDEEQALRTIGATNLVHVADPATRSYCFTFFHWLRSAQGGELLDEVARARAAASVAPVAPPAPAAAAGKVLGVCAQCGEQFEFPSRAAFEADSRMCDADVDDGGRCSGTIQLREAA